MNADPVEEVKSRLDLVEYVGEVVALKRIGRRRVGLCPFHAEKTPSFTVDPEQRLWHCFGCGKGGDVFTFAQEYHHLDFKAALQTLSERVGSPSSPPPPRRQVARVSAPPAPPKRTPLAEVNAFRAKCVPVTEDLDVRHWLEDPSTGRAIAAEAVARLRLAGALPIDTPTPRWAQKNVAPNPPPYDMRPWSTLGYRCIIPAYDASGTLATVRARRIIKSEDGLAKELGATGCETRGLVYANPIAQRLLKAETQAVDHVRRFGILIAEGGPDYLVCATLWANEEAEAPAVFGIFSPNCWTSDLTARIPRGIEVTIATDPDGAGTRYAEHINASLGLRCSVRKTILPSGMDMNDLLKKAAP